MFIETFFNIGRRCRKLVYFIDNNIITIDSIDSILTLIIVVIKTLLNPFLDINKAVPIKNNSEYQIGVFMNMFVCIELELTVAHSIHASTRHRENMNKNKFHKALFLSHHIAIYNL